MKDHNRDRKEMGKKDQRSEDAQRRNATTPRDSKTQASPKERRGDNY